MLYVPVSRNELPRLVPHVYDSDGFLVDDYVGDSHFFALLMNEDNYTLGCYESNDREAALNEHWEAARADAGGGPKLYGPLLIDYVLHPEYIDTPVTQWRDASGRAYFSGRDLTHGDFLSQVATERIERLRKYKRDIKETKESLATHGPDWGYTPPEGRSRT